MKKFVCSVCGYVYEGETAPDFCPICKAPKDKFVEQVGELKLAAEHEFGIYAKTVKNNPDISAEDKEYIFDQPHGQLQRRVLRGGHVPVHGPRGPPGGLSRDRPVLGEGRL